MEPGIAGLKIVTDEVETIALHLLGVIQHRAHLEDARARQRQPESRDGQTSRLSGVRQEIADRLARHRKGESGEEAQRHPEVEEGCCVERSHRNAEDQDEPGER